MGEESARASSLRRGSLKKETVNSHLSFREKTLSFSLTLKTGSESHSNPQRFHYKDVPKYRRGAISLPRPPILFENAVFKYPQPVLTSTITIQYKNK